MNRLKMLHKLNPKSLIKLSRRYVFLKSLTLLCIFTLVSIAVWLYAPLIAWKGHALLAQPEKRIYIIICLFLIWLLEFLITDLDIPKPFQFSNPLVQKKLLACQNRFLGAIKFLKKTSVNKNGKHTHLSQLPWFLLIGESDAGKTSMLAHSNIHFILQRQLGKQKHQTAPSSHCDWWITRDATIIDIAGRYFSPLNAATKADPKAAPTPLLWHFFLKLLRKYRGKKGINGIILLVPIAEYIQQDDNNKAVENATKTLINRLKDLQSLFPGAIPSYILFSKCDLLTGFSEYFAELGNDESAQSWGVNLADITDNKKIPSAFNQRFNALIKKINEQLITRLHHERHAASRSQIKDFPLEIEKLKSAGTTLIKELSSNCPTLSIQGIFLISSHQHPDKQAETALSNVNAANNRQLLQAPSPISRPYFIKYLLSHGLAKTYSGITSKWKHRAAYALSALLIMATATMLGHDFKKGVSNVYAMQDEIKRFQLTSSQFHNQEEQLIKTLSLLNSLQNASKKRGFKFDLTHLFSFYTYKSYDTAELIYFQSVQSILIPQIKNYFEDYLKVPVNKSNEQLYSALKAYLMLGDNQHFAPNFISQTLQTILPSSFSQYDIDQLKHHLNLAFRGKRQSFQLNAEVINKTRQFLMATPPLQLAYVILKDISSSHHSVDLKLIGANTDNSVFVSKEHGDVIPSMYTLAAFPQSYSNQLPLAAKQAIFGNWILGPTASKESNIEIAANLTGKLRESYIKNYVQTWERLLSSIQIANASNLAQTDSIINHLISGKSPLLKLLNTIRDNTFFQPIASSSEKLKKLGVLLEKNTHSEQQLYQIFAGLQSLHRYLNPVVTSKNAKKSAFEVLSARMQQTKPDPITQLRVIADRNPEPIKSWLNQIADDSWRFLSQDAGGYLNTAWHDKVILFYQNQIANRFPFSNQSNKDVSLDDFADFFGKPGIITSFYQEHLLPFIDNSKNEWKWKKAGENALPFSSETLRQIQLAMRINSVFFPNNDNKLFVQFALEAHQLGSSIKKVELNIGDKQIVDEKIANTPHVFTWPGKSKTQASTVQLTLADKKPVELSFTGEWSWFKMVDQAFESAINKKQMMLNFSKNESPAKYYLFTQSKINPFLSLDMKHFKLSDNLIS